MRIITVITRLNIGGASPPVISQAAALKARGHESLLVCGTPQPHEGSMEDDARAEGADVQRITSLRRNPHGVDDPRALAALIALFRQWRPDVVSTHMSKAGAIGRVAARLAGVPVVVHTYHGKGFHVFSSGAKERMALGMERVLARLSSANVVVSEKQRMEFVALGITPERLAVIRYGLDLDRFARANPADLHAELGLSVAVPLVGVVARLVRIKGQDVLLRAAASLRDQYPDVHYVIAGDGDARQGYETFARELRMIDRVHFLGWRRDVAAVLKTLSVVVLPTVFDFEGTPLAVIEAMAAGRPVVATAVGGTPELLGDGRGLLVRPGDARGLADAVAAVLTDPARAQAMATAARHWSRTHLHSDTMVQQYLDLYAGLVGRRCAA
jgi:glycosyltransferase involved in cell wall biosynthesis